MITFFTFEMQSPCRQDEDPKPEGFSSARPANSPVKRDCDPSRASNSHGNVGASEESSIPCRIHPDPEPAMGDELATGRTHLYYIAPNRSDCPCDALNRG